jgi:hypothetical protein
MSLEEKILNLRQLNYTYKQISETLGCSKGTVAYHVGENQKEKTKERSTRSRTKLKRQLWDIKEKFGCVDCGEKYPHYMLDFDHMPGFEKVGNVADIVANYSWEKGMKELEKCQVVCANCHRIRSYQRNQNNYKKR